MSHDTVGDLIIEFSTQITHQMMSILTESILLYKCMSDVVNSHGVYVDVD